MPIEEEPFKENKWLEGNAGKGEKSMRIQKGICKGLVFLLILCSVPALSACGYTAEEKALMAAYEKQGKENAQNYIEDKYGFQAKVTSVTCQKVDSSPIPDFSPAPSGGVFVDMEQEGKAFRVYVTGEEASAEGYDNYQADSIKQAIKEAATNIAGEVVGMQLCYGRFCELDSYKNYGMVSTYFDGSNLREVLGNADYNRAIISTVGQRLDVIENGMLTDSFGENVYYALVDYENRECYEVADDKSFNLTGYPIVYQIEDYALFIDEYRVFQADAEEYMDFQVEQFDDFYYCMIEGTYCNFEKTSVNNPSNWNGRGFINAEQIYDAYAVDSDAKSLIIWVPSSDISSKEEDGTRFVTQYYHEGETKYGTGVTWDIANGAYITTTLYPNRYEELIFSVFTDIE